MSRFRRFSTPTGLALLSSCLLAMAAPPLSQGWLAIPAVAAFIAATTQVQRLKHVFLLGVLHGAVHFLLLVNWVQVVAPIALIALVGLMALWAGVHAVLLWRVQTHRWRLLLWPATWVFVEMLQSWLPWGGFPWGRLAFVGGVGPLTQFAYLTSAAGLSFLIAILGALLWQSWRARRVVAPHIAGVVAVLVAIAAVAIFGPGESTPNGSIDVLVVQGGVPRDGLLTADQELRVFDNHLHETQRALGALTRSPQLIVWPESSLGYAALGDGSRMQQLRLLVDASGSAVLTGSVMDDSVVAGRLRNRAMLWQPGQGVTQIYDKRHLVPFGEFVPLRALARKLTAAVDLVGRDFRAGDRPGVFHLPERGESFGNLICFEVGYDNLVRSVATTAFLVNQTNNATYIGSSQPEQQFRMAQVRAAETGRAVVIAATSGVSGVISPRGVTVAGAKMSMNKSWSRMVRIPMSDEPVPAVWTGPVLHLLCVVGVLLGVLRPRAGTRRRGSDA